MKHSHLSNPVCFVCVCDRTINSSSLLLVTAANKHQGMMNDTEPLPEINHVS